jgi:hypothetical protein
MSLSTDQTNALQSNLRADGTSDGDRAGKQYVQIFVPYEGAETSLRLGKIDLATSRPENRRPSGASLTTNGYYYVSAGGVSQTLSGGPMSVYSHDNLNLGSTGALVIASIGKGSQSGAKDPALPTVRTTDGACSTPVTTHDRFVENRNAIFNDISEAKEWAGLVSAAVGLVKFVLGTQLGVGLTKVISAIGGLSAAAGLAASAMTTHRATQGTLTSGAKGSSLTGAQQKGVAAAATAGAAAETSLQNLERKREAREALPANATDAQKTAAQTAVAEALTQAHVDAVAAREAATKARDNAKKAQKEAKEAKKNAKAAWDKGDPKTRGPEPSTATHAEDQLAALTELAVREAEEALVKLRARPDWSTPTLVEKPNVAGLPASVEAAEDESEKARLAVQAAAEVSEGSPPSAAPSAIKKFLDEYASENRVMSGGGNRSLDFLRNALHQRTKFMNAVGETRAVVELRRTLVELRTAARAMPESTDDERQTKTAKLAALDLQIGACDDAVRIRQLAAVERAKVPQADVDAAVAAVKSKQDALATAGTQAERDAATLALAEAQDNEALRQQARADLLSGEGAERLARAKVATQSAEAALGPGGRTGAETEMGRQEAIERDTLKSAAERDAAKAEKTRLENAIRDFEAASADLATEQAHAKAREAMTERATKVSDALKTEAQKSRTFDAAKQAKDAADAEVVRTRAEFEVASRQFSDADTAWKTVRHNMGHPDYRARSDAYDQALSACESATQAHRASEGDLRTKATALTTAEAELHSATRTRQLAEADVDAVQLQRNATSANRAGARVATGAAVGSAAFSAYGAVTGLMSAAETLKAASEEAPGGISIVSDQPIFSGTKGDNSSVAYGGFNFVTPHVAGFNVLCGGGIGLQSAMPAEIFSLMGASLEGGLSASVVAAGEVGLVSRQGEVKVAGVTVTLGEAVPDPLWISKLASTLNPFAQMPTLNVNIGAVADVKIEVGAASIDVTPTSVTIKSGTNLVTVSPSGVSVTATGKVSVTAPDIALTGKVAITGDVAITGKTSMTGDVKIVGSGSATGTFTHT